MHIPPREDSFLPGENCKRRTFPSGFPICQWSAVWVVAIGGTALKHLARKHAVLAVIVVFLLSLVTLAAPEEGASPAGEQAGEAPAAWNADETQQEGQEAVQPASPEDGVDKPASPDEQAAEAAEDLQQAEEQPAADQQAQDPQAEEQQPSIPVRAVVVRGNRYIPAERILEVIQATQVGQPLRVEDVQADLRSIYELGYFEDVRADAFEVEGGVRVVFEVWENPLLEEVRVESSYVDPQEIRSWLQIKEGEVLNNLQLERDLMTVQERALAQYGLYLRPSRVEMEEGVLHLEFTAAHVAEVRVTGNEKTRDYVILREITLEPGELLTRQDINRSLDRLQRLGFFQDVQVQGFDTADPDQVAVEFRVEERRTGSAAFGAGYSSQDGFLGYVEVSDINFLGRGQRVNAKAEFGQRRTTYDLGFYEPYLFGSTTSFGINLYNRSYDRVFRDRPEDDYQERRTGGDISFGRPLGEYTRGTVRFRVENLEVEPLGEKSTREPSSGSTRSVTVAARTDTTDHWLNPLRGFRSRVSAEMAGHFLGGTFDFTKYEAEYSQFFQVGSNRQTIAVRALGGLSFGEIREAAEEFRVGGTDTVRGYTYGSMIGDRMAVFNAEYRFPISDNVHGVVFADVGTAWMNGEEDPTFKAGYGIGARLDTPIGVLRLDYGIGEEGGRLHFQLGPSF